MAAQEKAEGHAAEHSSNLHNLLKNQFSLDLVKVYGSNTTKTDIIGLKGDDSIRFSLKFASGKNTQVWLPTLRSMVSHVPALVKYQNELDQWLGTPDTKLFETRRVGKTLAAAEIKKQRIYSDKIDNWESVIQAFNDATKDKSLLKNMLLAKGDEPNVDNLIWSNKKQGGIQILNMSKFVDHIATNCVWQNPIKGFTTLWCIDKTTDKKIFHLQRKGSGDGVQAYAPMFHIYNNWPQSLVIYSDPTFRIN